MATLWRRASLFMLLLWLPAGTAGAEPTPARRCEAVEECSEQCDAGVATGCSSLGILYASGMGVPKDAARARALFERACKAGEPTGCCNLGVLYGRGSGVEHEPRRAARLYNQACDQGDAACCSNAGSYLERGLGQRKDLARAERYYLRACDGGDGTGCFNLGRMYAMRDAPDAGARLSARAIQAYERGCRSGHEGSCRQVPPFTLSSEAWLDDDLISLTAGQRLRLECEVDGARILRMHRVAFIQHPDRTLELEFKEVENLGRPFMMLTVKNPFSRGLKYEAAVQLRGSEAFLRTNTIPVRPGLFSSESWPNPMTRIVLSEFRLQK